MKFVDSEDKHEGGRWWSPVKLIRWDNVEITVYRTFMIANTSKFVLLLPRKEKLPNGQEKLRDHAGTKDWLERNSDDQHVFPALNLDLHK